MTGFNHIAWFYSVYIMSSCLVHYSVCHELNTIDAGRSRSIGGLIVVDAESFWSTFNKRDAYIHDHCHEYRRNYALFYQLPNSILLTQCMLCFEREASSENHGLWVYFNHITKTKNTLLQVYSFYFTFQFIYLSLSDLILQLIAEGFTTACSCWVEGFVILRAGAANEVLRGSPNGLITLILN